MEDAWAIGPPLLARRLVNSLQIVKPHAVSTKWCIQYVSAGGEVGQDGRVSARGSVPTEHAAPQCECRLAVSRAGG